MIEIVDYAIGFIIYMAFNIMTFEAYSKKQEITNRYVLFLIYIYYSVIASYVIYLMDYNIELQNNMEIIMQSLVYIILAAFILYFIYQNIITLKDEKMFGNQEGRL